MNIRTLKRGLKKHILVVLLGIYLILISIYNSVGIENSVIWDCFYYTIELGAISLCLLTNFRNGKIGEKLIKVGIVSYKISLLLLIYIAAIISNMDYEHFRDSMGSNTLCLTISSIVAVILLTILKVNKK